MIVVAATEARRNVVDAVSTGYLLLKSKKLFLTQRDTYWAPN
jgi:hypothetical protein